MYQVNNIFIDIITIVNHRLNKNKLIKRRMFRQMFLFRYKIKNTFFFVFCFSLRYWVRIIFPSLLIFDWNCCDY